MRNCCSATKAIIVFAVAIALLGCSGPKIPAEWGKRLDFLGSDLFYTPAVTEAEARALGDYLVKNAFFTKERKGTVQLDKKDGVYQFRMVADEAKIKNPEFLNLTGNFAATLSYDLFNKQKLEIHLCDQKFNTLQAVGFEIGGSK